MPFYTFSVEQEARRKAIRERERFIGLQIIPTASLEDDAEGREPGDDNWTGFGFDVHPHVTSCPLLCWWPSYC